MLIAANRGLGMAFHFPDVCKIPVPPAIVPTPLPDLGMNAQSVPHSPNVSVTCLPATNLATKKVMTMGDEAGVGGGLISGIIKGMTQLLMGAVMVFVNMLPGENLLNPSAGNNFNAPLGANVVPSLSNVFYTFRVGPAETWGRPETVVPFDALHYVVHGGGTLAVRELGDGRLHIELPLFAVDTPRRIFNLLDGRDDLRELVIDLRNSPGGDARAALTLADDFVEAGTPLARFIDSDGDEELIRARHQTHHQLELIVLVDGGTASAAELFAGCLQHAGRATVVGERTSGKATVHTVSQGGTYAAVGTYVRADGSAWHHRGLEPDGPLSAAQRLRGS